MSYKKQPFIGMLISGIISLVCFILGSYFYCRMLAESQLAIKIFYLSSLLFFVALFFLIIFFQRSIVSIQKVIDEKYELQKSHLDKLNKISEGTLKALSTALDYRDHGTWGHSARVVGYALAIGIQIGLDEGQLMLLTWGGFLHDIGKIGVADGILLKESKLTNDEWEWIKKHPQLGFDIVNKVDFLKEAADIVLHHHERYDGQGYPEGLKGENISLLARIFAVADALDAMTSDRPYRPAMDIQRALEEIAKLSGMQFCPESVNALKQIGLIEITKIKENIRNISDIDGLKNNFECEYEYTNELLIS